MPFFSIIVPLYNKEQFIEATIKSILEQRFTDFELLLINDGSTDKSKEIVLQFDDQRIQYFYKENGGVSSARNFGIAKANGDYITFIDADDYWYPEYLETIFSNIKKYPSEMVFSTAIEMETAKNRIPAVYSVKKIAETMVLNYFESSYIDSIMYTSCATFHKQVFIEIGLFDTEIRSGQDTDMWIRIGQIYPIVFSFKILARYVYDQESLSKNNAYLHQKLDFSKFTAAEKNNPALKKFLDFNRFSLAIKCKLNSDYAKYGDYVSAIDCNKLPLKKRILLQLPAVVLKQLLFFNDLMLTLGIRKTIFK